MNPHRLVAAVAALAIGFGITLAGVGLADDASSADAPATENGGIETDGDTQDDVDVPAEQQEEIAAEAGPAEIEPPGTQDADQAENQQGPTSSTCSDLAEAGASDAELLAEGCQSEDSDDVETGPQATCRVVYEVTQRDGDQLFVVVRMVVDEGVTIEPDGDFLEEGREGVARLDEIGFFYVDPNWDPILERPCDNVGEVVDLEDLVNQGSAGSLDDATGDSTEDVRSASADEVFPCDLPVQRVIDDLEVDEFLDLDGDGDESDWESYITLLDVALGQASRDTSFDWGRQTASTAASATFQELDCDLADEIWDELVEAPLAGARVDPGDTVCFLVQFVELERRSDGDVDNPFIDYLDNFGPAVAGCPIFDSMVL